MKPLLVLLLLLATLLLSACSIPARVGPMLSDTQSVALGDFASAKVEIDLGAGDLTVDGGADELLEADFVYNVARLKPEVRYANGVLTVRQPNDEGLPNFIDIGGFHNQWTLHLRDATPMELAIDVGAGSSQLHLAGLALSRLDFSQGAGMSLVDLSGDWAHDLDVAIDAGAAEVTVRLPRDVGVRVDVDAGPAVVSAPELAKTGNVYTNAAYGVADVTMEVDLSAGVGLVSLDLAD